jgi:hypothetical protein
MPSPPDLFDDEDGIGPDHEQAPPATQRADEPQPSASGTGRRGGPNYLFRRAVVVGGVVAVLATASIVVGQLIGSGSQDSTSGAVGTDWNRVVLVDDRTGRVIVDDEQGEEVARIESGVRSPTASAIVDSTLIVAGTDNVVVVDIGTESVDEFDLGSDVVVRPSGSALTLLAPAPDRGRAVLAHGPSGEVIDTDTFAPVVGARYEFDGARSSPSGRDVLVTDSGNFQSVLISFDRDEPSFFPGLALAVDDDLVVTAQNVGSDATINVFDHAGEPVATGRTSSVRAGMITDAGAVLVTVEGVVVTMSTSSGDTADGARLDIGTIESGSVTPDGDRLVVTGATGTAIVGADGDVIASYDAQRPATDMALDGSSCLATVSSDDTAETQIAISDTNDGSVLVEASGSEPLLSDASGCTVATTTPSGYDLLSAEGVSRFETDDTAVALSLDGAALAVERNGRLVLTGSDPDASTDPIDLGPRGRTVHFTQS